MKKKMLIGLTGSIGSGKSTVLTMFKNLGARVLSADDMVAEILKKNKDVRRRIEQNFGSSALTVDGVNKNMIAKIVFDDPIKRKTLESIIHPEFRRTLKAELLTKRPSESGEVTVVEIPLLFEANMQGDMDKTICVTADEEQCIQRACQSRGFTREDVIKRMNAQMSMNDKVRLADFQIDNSQDKQLTQEQVKVLWQELTEERTK